ncbi:hypothetical protein [Streptomyces antarcticus]|uniref:hypothetical protein n=1 Tax=Streptomyces antarcticus TaxID=2996458 RepID=UPI00226E0B3B|nr:MULTISPECIES: hypothetical protein [unclassified Streptomyces]MCY0947597.1 hypothetical protein [Streptomyces sp. H34-AA3]MCZ4085348.1 hypothetical protein [Streptomyces sp. H34-S5]
MIKVLFGASVGPGHLRQGPGLRDGNGPGLQEDHPARRHRGYVRTFPDASSEVSGIPGLRLERVTRKALLLHHLPTGGCIEVRESIGEVSLRDMQDLLEEETRRPSHLAKQGDDRRKPAWTQAGLTPGEAAMAPHWAPTPTTALRSALLARANLWWSTFRHRAHLAPARRSNAERCLRWAAGHTTDEIGSPPDRQPTQGPRRPVQPAQRLLRRRADPTR